MANLEEIVRRVRIEYVTSGEKEVARALGQLAVSQQTVAASSETITKAQTGAERAYARVRRELDAAAKAQDIFVRQTLDMKRAVEAGLISTIKEFNAFGDAAKRAFEKAGSATSQADPTKMLGISLSGASAQKSAAAFEAHFKHLEEMAALHAEQIGKQFGENLDRSMIAGVAKSAKDSASVFEAEFKRLEDIAALKAQQIGQEFSRALNQRLGVGAPTKSASESAGVFQQMEREAKAADDLRKKYVPLYAIEQQLAASQAELVGLRKSGVISLEEYAAAQQNVIAASKAQATVHQQLTRATGLTSYQVQNLGFQLNDVFTGLASGQRPLQVLTQQFGQFVQIAQSASGGWGAIGRQIAGMFTLGRVAIGTLVTGLLLAVESVNRYRNEILEATVTTQGLGRGLGMTVDGFMALSEEAAKVGKLTRGQASETANAIARAGQVSGANLIKLTSLTKDFAATFTGGDFKKAGEQLAGLLSADGVEALNRQMKFLSAGDQKRIRDLFETGRAQEAINAASSKLQPVLVNHNDSIGQIAKLWEAAKAKYLEYDAAVAKKLNAALGGGSERERLEAQLAEAQARLADAERLRAQRATPNAGGVQMGTLGIPYGTPLSKLVNPDDPKKVQDLAEEVKGLQTAIENLGRAEKKVADDKAFESNLNSMSLTLKDLIGPNGFGKGTDDFMKATKTLTALKGAIKQYGEEVVGKALEGTSDWKVVLDKLQTSLIGATDAQGKFIDGAEREEQVRAKQREIEALGGTDPRREAKIRAEIKELELVLQLNTAKDRQNQIDGENLAFTARQTGFLAALNREQQNQLATLSKEREVILATDEARAEALAQLKTEQDLTKEGILLSDARAQARIKDAKAIAQQNVELGKQRQAIQFVEGLGSSFASTAVSGFFTSGPSQMEELATFKRVMDQTSDTVQSKLMVSLERSAKAMEAMAGAGKSLASSLASKGFSQLFSKDALAGIASGKPGEALSGAGMAVGGTLMGMGLQRGSMLLSVGGGALAGAAAGSMVAPGIGTAVGAAVGAGLGLVTGLMQQAANKQQRLLQIQQATIEAAQKLREKAESAAARQAGFQDQLFNALQNADTLEGQLAIFDRQSLRAREAESRAGGEAMVDLEANIAEGRLGIIRDFEEQATTVEEEAAQKRLDILETQLSFQDRLFAATNKNDTLEGALALFDRNAQREREKETAAGGEAINDLEAALAAERLNIVTDFAERAAEVEEKAKADALEIEKQKAADALEIAAEAAAAINESNKTALEAAISARDAQIQAATDAAQANERIANEAAERQRAIADRRQNFADRAYLAAQNTSTLEGALAAFDLQALRERQAEMRNGGEAIAELETALAQERLNIIADFAQRALEEQQRTAEEQQRALEEQQKRQRDAVQDAKDFFADLTRSLRKFIDDLKGGANSPLSPKERLAAAQTAYDAQLALAQGGNRDALSGISGYAQTLLDASRDYNASGPAYQDTFNTVISQLEELPALVDPIVAAIEQQTIDLLSGFGVKAAGGGWISGGGTGTSDSINASLSNGEFVVRSSVAAQNPWLGDFNRYGTMPSNDNGSMLQRLDAIERTLAVVGNAVVAATTEGAASVVTATTRGHAKSAEAVRLAENRPRRTGT